MAKKAKFISVKSSGSEFEVAEVLRKFGKAYRRKYPPTPQQAKVLGSLMACRTAQLGGHLNRCDECGAFEFEYHSCRDRHCPKCGKFKKAEWVHNQQIVLLPSRYFHFVFTTDHALNGLFAGNRRVLYNLLFQSASATLKAFGQEYVGGEIGITAVLHTWGQQLQPHVHLHCIVTGGALDVKAECWRHSKPKFFAPVVAMSRYYRDKFTAGLEKLWRAEKLDIAGVNLSALLTELRSKDWTVFAKGFKKPQVVYDYLSRYVHQVALSNRRIIGIDRHGVSLTYYDNKDLEEGTDRGKEKVLRLSGVEFIRRFVWHILPAGFRRIRHYGLHHPSARAKLSLARRVLGLDPAVPEAEEFSLWDWLVELFGEEEINRCPRCGAANSMRRIRDNLGTPTWVQRAVLGLFGMAG